MRLSISKIALGQAACLLTLLLGTNVGVSHAQDGCPNPPPNVEATPQPTPTFAPKAWDTGLGIGVVPDEDGTPATTSGPPPLGGQPLLDGRIKSPQDQRTNNPATPLVRMGHKLNCEVESATDSDHWSQTDGRPCSKDPDGIDDDGITYHWTCNGGKFKGPNDAEGNPTYVSSIDGQSAEWIAPNTQGRYTLTCTIDDTPKAVDDPDTLEIETGSRDDEAITRSCLVRVYGFYPRFETPKIAAGAVETSAHQAIYKLIASDGYERIPGLTAPTPEVLTSPKGNLGENASVTAKCTPIDTVTDADGIATGTFTSGSRTAQGAITIDGFSATIDQTWNELTDFTAKWKFEPEAFYNEVTPVLYRMKYDRGGTLTPIDGHQLRCDTVGISVSILIESPTELDEDGNKVLEYQNFTLVKGQGDQTRWDKAMSLIEWTASEEKAPGEYEFTLKIKEDTTEGAGRMIVEQISFEPEDQNTFEEADAS